MITINFNKDIILIGEDLEVEILDATTNQPLTNFDVSVEFSNLSKVDDRLKNYSFEKKYTQNMSENKFKILGNQIFRFIGLYNIEILNKDTGDISSRTIEVQTKKTKLSELKNTIENKLRINLSEREFKNFYNEFILDLNNATSHYFEYRTKLKDNKIELPSDFKAIRHIYFEKYPNWVFKRSEGDSFYNVNDSFINYKINQNKTELTFNINKPSFDTDVIVEYIVYPYTFRENMPNISIDNVDFPFEREGEYLLVLFVCWQYLLSQDEFDTAPYYESEYRNNKDDFTGSSGAEETVALLDNSPTPPWDY